MDRDEVHVDFFMIGLSVLYRTNLLSVEILNLSSSHRIFSLCLAETSATFHIRYYVVKAKTPKKSFLICPLALITMSSLNCCIFDDANDLVALVQSLLMTPHL